MLGEGIEENAADEGEPAPRVSGMALVGEEGGDGKAGQSGQTNKAGADDLGEV